MEFFAGIGAGWMNLASLALGLLAWMLPVAAMIRTSHFWIRLLPRRLTSPVSMFTPTSMPQPPME